MHWHTSAPCGLERLEDQECGPFADQSSVAGRVERAAGLARVGIGSENAGREDLPDDCILKRGVGPPGDHDLRRTHDDLLRSQGDGVGTRCTRGGDRQARAAGPRAMDSAPLRQASVLLAANVGGSSRRPDLIRFKLSVHFCIGPRTCRR